MEKGKLAVLTRWEKKKKKGSEVVWVLLHNLKEPHRKKRQKKSERKIVEMG